MPPRGADPLARLERAVAELALRHGTPCYVYSLPAVRARAAELRAAFPGLELSFALKSNPNAVLAARLRELVDEVEVSSLGELRGALAAGWPAERTRFTGPAKRSEELEAALDLGVGCVVLESLEEGRELAALARARGREQLALVRVSPRSVPPGFGMQLDGKPSRFGVDEEELGPTLAALAELPGLGLRGFHVFPGSQCLRADSLVRHLVATAELFERAAGALREPPDALVFGAGFGIATGARDRPFDLAAVAAGARPALDALARRFPRARRVLELGRYLVGEAGLYVTRVLRVKHSRGSRIAICDGGMHHNQAACGLFGGVLQGSRSMFVPGAPEGEGEEWDVVGPLCTALDTLARRARLAGVRPGALVVVRASGAYGLSASPSAFLGHPPPRELLVEERGGELVATDASADAPR